MNLDHLLRITASMPMRTIQVGGADYLQRYYASTTEDGGQWWYHRFLRADSERHLHTHPWHGTAMLLRGRYVEQLRPVGNINDINDRRRYFSVGRVNEIHPETLHRIVEVEPDTWTLLYIAPGRRPTWKFIAEDGSETVVQSSPEDWWKDCGVRG